MDTLAEEEEEDHQDGSGAEGEDGEDLPGTVGDRGGIVVRGDCEDGVTQPECGVEDYEDQDGGDGFGEAFHWGAPCVPIDPGLCVPDSMF